MTSADSTGERRRGTPSRGPRELVVMTRPEAGVRVAGTDGRRPAAAPDIDVEQLRRTLTEADALMTPLFGVSEERARTVAPVGADTPDLSLYYRVRAGEEALVDLAVGLQGCEPVEATYVKPQPSPVAVSRSTTSRFAEWGWRGRACASLKAQFVALG